MAEISPTDQFITAIADVVQGWNEKLALTDDQLALIVPFCDLYAIYTGDEQISDSGEKRLLDSGFTVKLKDYSNQPETVTLVPVFNLIDQQTSVDPKTGQLLHPRGIGGIVSARVTTHNADLGAYQVSLQLEVPSFDDDVITNRAIRKLVIPGTDWIVAYGWARDSSQVGKTFAPIVNNVIDLTSSHRGYYRFLKCNLQKFQWSVNTNRVVSGTLEFWPYTKLAGLLATANVHRRTIRRLLTDDSPNLQASCPIEIKNQLPKTISVMKKRVISGRLGDAKKKISKEEVGYYRLGWVIEAMRQAIEDTKNPRFKMLMFEKWLDPKKTNVMGNADGSSQPSAITCSSPAEIPISINDLDSEVFDVTTNESILWSIDRVCSLANKQLLNASALFVEITGDGSTISIRDANDVAFYVANRSDAMKIGVSTPNSLLTGINLTSRVPIDLSWNFKFFINTDKGATILYDIFEKEASSNSTKVSETAQLIRKFNKSAVGDKKALDANRLANWKSYLATNAKDKIEQISQEVSTSQTVPVGLALRYFFKSISVNIHGTAMVPPATQLDIEGILPGIDGQYQVFQLTDTLAPGSFSTELEAILLIPH